MRWIVTFSKSYIHPHASACNNAHYYKDDDSSTTSFANENNLITGFVTT